jgi:hypothetical protein
MKVRLLFKALTPGLFILIATTAFAQNRIIRNDGFYYTFEANAGYGLTMKSDYYKVDAGNDFTPFNFGAKATANIFLSTNLSVGAGLGYTEYHDPKMRTIPLTANIKYFTAKQARSPFIYADGGYAFRTDADKQHKGPVYELGIGYRHRLQRRYNFLLFKLGYSYFKTKHWIWDTREGTQWTDRDFQWYYLERPAVVLSICFYHSTRF